MDPRASSASDFCPHVSLCNFITGSIEREIDREREREKEREGDDNAIACKIDMYLIWVMLSKWNDNIRMFNFSKVKSYVLNDVTCNLSTLFSS